MTNNTTILKQTDEQPNVEVELGSNTISMEGVCMPENAVEMFKPIFDIIQELLSKKENIRLNFNLKYLNSMSSKQLLRLLFEIDDSESSYSVVWKFSDGDQIMKSKGEELQSILDISDFKFEAI